MANELSLTLSASYTDAAAGIPTQTITANGAKVAVAGGSYVRQVATVTTSKAPIDIGGLASVGYMVLHNCDTTNYVDIYQDGSVASPALRLNPGEWQVLRMPPASVPNAKANTASVKLEYLILAN